MFFLRTIHRHSTLMTFWARDHSDLKHLSALQQCARYQNHPASLQHFIWLRRGRTQTWAVHSRLTIPRGVSVSTRRQYPVYTKRTTITVSTVLIAVLPRGILNVNLCGQVVCAESSISFTKISELPIDKIAFIVLLIKLISLARSLLAWKHWQD